MELNKIIGIAIKDSGFDVTSYVAIIQQYARVNDVSVEQVYGSLLKKLEEEFNKTASKNDRFSKSNDNACTLKINKDLEDTTRFFINVGKVDGVTDQKLLALLQEINASIVEGDFSDMYLCGTYSFFEIKKELGEDILAKFAGHSFNGRDVSIEISKKREKDGGPRRSSYGRGGDSRGGDRGGSSFGRSRSYGNRDDSRSNSSYGGGNSYGRGNSYGGGDRGGRSDSRGYGSSRGGSSYGRRDNDRGGYSGGDRGGRSYGKKY